MNLHVPSILVVGFLAGLSIKMLQYTYESFANRDEATGRGLIIGKYFNTPAAKITGRADIQPLSPTPPRP